MRNFPHEFQLDTKDCGPALCSRLKKMIPLSLVGTTKKMAQWLGGKHTLILI